MSDPATAQTSFQAPSVWRLALRQLWRDWRAGELRLLGLAVLLAVAAATAVGFLSDRLDRGPKRDAPSCWAATWWPVTSPRQPCWKPWPSTGSRSRTVTFPSMARPA